MIIGYITSRDEKDLTSDDRLAFPFLEAEGHSVVPVIWDETTSFHHVDILIFRSCWDYHRKRHEFLKWCQNLQAQKIPVLNPIDVVLWNMHKKYLLELDVKIPHTHLLNQNSDFKESYLSEFNNKLVIKPAVSLNGHDTHLVSLENKAEIRSLTESLLQGGDVLLQEYLPEIESSGEQSYLFFNGEFSHALRKVPKSGEFRIHVEYGGSRTAFTPTDHQLKQASHMQQKVKTNLLYARIDVVERDGELLMMEYEAIDPFLYLGYGKNAPEHFAKALISRLP